MKEFLTDLREACQMAVLSAANMYLFFALVAPGGWLFIHLVFHRH